MNPHQHNEANGNPTSVLREEHQVILRVLRAFARFLDTGQNSGNWDFQALGECISFFRLYADACHHGKEEDLLFPALESKGMPREGGPIAVMLYEHQLGRERVSVMAQALPGAQSGDAGALQRLIESGRAYIELLTEHIGKEDHCLFAMAERMIDPASCRGLCHKYHEVSCGRFEGETKQALEQIAQRLESKAG
ncbi:MAG: hypothetical protein HC901_00750 [Bdellovibrionaceae bacterium]|nr:hypothetical protein [Pseudobdellovibrionaceae bacterium]